VRAPARVPETENMVNKILKSPLTVCCGLLFVILSVENFIGKKFRKNINDGITFSPIISKHMNGNLMLQSIVMSILCLLGFICCGQSQKLHSSNMLKPGDTIHVAVFFEVNEDRYKSLHHVYVPDSAVIDAAIRKKIDEILGRNLVLVPFNKNCLSIAHPDSLALKNEKKLLEMFHGCNDDRILSIGIVWRFKSHPYYNEEERSHKRTTSNGTEINTLGLVGRAYLVNVAILSTKEHKVLYRNNLVIEKSVEGGPTKDNLRYAIPIVVRRSIKPIRKIIKS
jgi:hypothetical protein